MPGKSHSGVPELKQRSRLQELHGKTPSEDQEWRLKWRHKLAFAALVFKPILKLTSGDAIIASEPDPSYPNDI